MCSVLALFQVKSRVSPVLQILPAQWVTQDCSGQLHLSEFSIIFVHFCKVRYLDHPMDNFEANQLRLFHWIYLAKIRSFLPNKFLFKFLLQFSIQETIQDLIQSSKMSSKFLPQKESKLPSKLDNPCLVLEFMDLPRFIAIWNRMNIRSAYEINLGIKWEWTVTFLVSSKMSILFWSQCFVFLIILFQLNFFYQLASFKFPSFSISYVFN